MSLLGSDHTFAAFVSGKSVASEGQRLAQVTFKTPRDKKTPKRDSKCVSVPALNVTTEQCHTMRTHILAMLEKAQDGIIRDMVIAGKTSVNDDEIAFAACLEYMDAEVAGTRISKESVIEWFDAENGLADTLTLVFAEKLGVAEKATAEEESQIAEAVESHRTVLASLAGGKTMLEKPIALQLQKTLEKFCGSDDAMATRFIGRLERMQNKELPKLLSALDL